MLKGQIFNALIEFFEADDWKFSWMEGLPILRMGFTGKNARWTCYAQAREEQQQFVFYSVSPINVPEAKRSAIAEFIARANYGMIIGNFELDFRDGEIRYKTSIDVEGTTLNHFLIKPMVYTNIMIMDRYLPGMMRVIYGDVPPDEAVAAIEDDFRPAPDDLLDDDERSYTQPQETGETNGDGLDEAADEDIDDLPSLFDREDDEPPSRDDDEGDVPF